MPAMFWLLMLQAHYTISAERQRQEIITLTGCLVQQEGLVLQVSFYLSYAASEHLLQHHDTHLLYGISVQHTF